jgi:uncharacterized membrane protein YgcG
MPALRMAGATVALGLALLGTAVGTGAAGAATPGVPYTDPDVTGYIGLCDQAGHQVTSGSLAAAPFAYRAVSSQAAPAGYNGASRTATLAAYLPMQVLPPGDWSGEQLTATSRYTNPAHPMTAGTTADESLQTFVADFPPEWDGFVQIRMFLGAANQPALTTRYPALDIQVTGSTWTAVGGGPVDCNSGTSESLETIVLPTTASGTGTDHGSVTGAAHTSPGGSSGSGSGSGTSSGSGGAKAAAPAAHAGGTHPASPATVSDTSTHVPLIVGIVLAALAVLATLVLLTRRRRGTHPDPPEPTISS